MRGRLHTVHSADALARDIIVDAVTAALSQLVSVQPCIIAARLCRYASLTEYGVHRSQYCDPIPCLSTDLIAARSLLVSRSTSFLDISSKCESNFQLLLMDFGDYNDAQVLEPESMYLDVETSGKLTDRCPASYVVSFDTVVQ
jgi:hypothetical protein